MSRIAGVNVPGGKVIYVALTSIYGIGRSVAMKICTETKIAQQSLFKDLKEEEVGRIRTYIEKHCLIEGDLRRGRSTDIKRLMDLGCYRGLRHRKRLPVRGQRTRTNARTHKGASRPVAGKK